MCIVILLTEAHTETKTRTNGGKERNKTTCPTFNGKGNQDDPCCNALTVVTKCSPGLNHFKQLHQID